MTRTKTARWVGTIGAVLALALGAGTALAQNATTGNLSGTVTDQQGGVLPGVTVTATHQPTGTKYEGVTTAEGRYQMAAVRVGGPYTVTASLSGFTDKTEANVTVGLGEAREVDFKLVLANVSETVTVVGAAPVIDTARAGTASNVKQEVIENLPTIARSLTDIARTSPYFSESNSNGGDSFLSVAGRNNRYNNIQIDGAVNNDLFGLAANGTPGGPAGVQPISYDAIGETQFVVSSYDVRQGGFSGGSVNVITKSGTNKFNGTGYFYSRSESLVGQIASTFSTDKTKVGLFNDRQGGASFGGPLVKNKAFFFANVDIGRKATPNGFSASGTTGQPWGHTDEVNRIIAIAKGYGYDPGGTDEFSKRGPNEKVFVRTDFNLSTRNQLTVRTNYINALADQSASSPSSIIYFLPGNFYAFTAKTSTTVGQLNSTWNTAFNEFRVTYQRERDLRDPGQPFPNIQVEISGGANVRLGAETSSQQNRLDQDVVEVTDDFTWLKGTHTFTFGTHNEFFKFVNVFVQNFYGSYRFSSIDNFAAGIAGGFNHNFSNTADPLQPAKFSVRQLGVYVGDAWRARANLTLTYGVRFDKPNFPDVPNANPQSVAQFGYRTDIAPAPNMFSPRIGFNWDLSGGTSARKQLRGGIGSFAGRTPYVWLSNQYGNTGVDFTALAVTYNAANRVPFVADPNNQPTSVPGGIAGNQTLNFVDPNYKYPQVLRGNLAYDHELGLLGLVGTAEVLLSKNQNEIAYQNLNYIPIGTRLDGRPIYAKKISTINDAILLTNTDTGSQYSLSYSLNRPFKNGWFVGGSYLYGRAKSVMDGTSSTASSNFFGVYQAGDINNPPLTTSDFDVRSRVTITASIPIPLGGGVRSTATFYYNGQSGRPYSIIFNNDVNLDSRTTNDLIFVPATADQVNVINGTWAQLDAFLSADDATKNYRGQIAPRNTGRAPWTNKLDFHYAVDVPTRSRAKVELTMDVTNLLNLLNHEWGWVYYPNFGGPTIIGATVGADGKYTYNLNTITGANFLAQDALWGVAGTQTRDDLRSRWQAQWGARIRF
jgi:hypothetical protein